MAGNSCEVSCSMLCRRDFARCGIMAGSKARRRPSREDEGLAAVANQAFPDDTRSREVAGLALSRLDLLARQRSRSAACRRFLKSPASDLQSSLSRLRRCVERRDDPERRRPHHLPRAPRSRDALSGQRVMTMIERHKIPGTSIFKIRSEPCPWNVRAEVGHSCREGRK